MKGHKLYKYAMREELSRKNWLKIWIMRNAVAISFIFVFINLGILWYVYETTSIFFIDKFFNPLAFILFVITTFCNFYAIYTLNYIKSTIVVIPNFIPILLSIFIVFTPISIDTAVKNEILASMDETEQKVFKERYSLGRFGFYICNKDDYSSQRCIDYLNDIIDDTKKKAQEIKDTKEIEKREQENQEHKGAKNEQD